MSTTVLPFILPASIGVPMTTPYLVITDGTDTATFLDGSTSTIQPYFVESGAFAPAIAAFDGSPFGVRGLYDDVVEEINTRITGSTAADVYSKLKKITRLLDKAD